jgi:hypothetical protein
MLARSFPSWGVAALATLAMAACASTAGPGSESYVTVSRVRSLTPTSRLYDAERIRRTGAQTAWDAVRMLVPSYRLQPARGSSLQTLGTRDARQFEPPIQLIIDGHQIRDLDALHAIPAGELIAIHLLSATEAGTYFGPGISVGAIVIQTKTSMRSHPLR